MKRIFFYFTFVFLLNTITFGQIKFTVYADEEETQPITNNDTMLVIADSSSQVTFDFFAYLKNNTVAEIDVHIELTPIYVSEDNSLQLCYGGTFYTTLYCDGKIPVDSAGELHVSLYYTDDDTLPNLIKTTIYDNSKGDTSVFYVKFVPKNTTSVFNPFAKSFKISKPYPNPANEFVKFSYSNPYNNAKLTIYSILGDVIMTKEISHDNGILNINTSNLKTGYYIYSVSVGNKKIVTDRLLIKH